MLNVSKRNYFYCSALAPALKHPILLLLLNLTYYFPQAKAGFRVDYFLCPLFLTSSGS